MLHEKTLRISIEAKQGCKVSALTLDNGYNFGYIFFNGSDIITSYQPMDTVYGKGYISLLAKYAK